MKKMRRCRVLLPGWSRGVGVERGGVDRPPPIASVVERRVGTAAWDRSIGLVTFRGWLPRILQKRLYIAAPKPFDPPDRMTGEFATSDHPIYRHRRELQKGCELTDGIKLGLDVIV